MTGDTEELRRNLLATPLELVSCDELSWPLHDLIIEGGGCVGKCQSVGQWWGGSFLN
jgi:hypothetical protein